MEAKVWKEQHSPQSPLAYIPATRAEDERLKFEESVNAFTGMNEVERSSFYRIAKQSDFLRETLKEVERVSILDVGPAHFQEATVFFALAKNAGVQEIDITYVDIQPRESLRVETGLGINILKQPIQPPKEDGEAFEFTDGQYRPTADILDSVARSIGDERNHFDSTVEQYVANFQEESDYHLVACNNVLQYLGRGQVKYDNPFDSMGGDFKTFSAVVAAVAEKVSHGGALFIAVNKDKKLLGILGEYTNFREIFECRDEKAGIYVRISPERLVMN